VGLLSWLRRFLRRALQNGDALATQGFGHGGGAVARTEGERAGVEVAALVGTRSGSALPSTAAATLVRYWPVPAATVTVNLSPTMKSVAPSAMTNLIWSAKVAPTATSPSTTPLGSSTRKVPELEAAVMQVMV
jgi:hypothetical protein